MGKLLIVGTVAFDAIETPFGKTDKILGGAATFIGLAASQFNVKSVTLPSQSPHSSHITKHRAHDLQSLQ